MLIALQQILRIRPSIGRRCKRVNHFDRHEKKKKNTRLKNDVLTNKIYFVVEPIIRECPACRLKNRNKLEHNCAILKSQSLNTTYRLTWMTIINVIEQGQWYKCRDVDGRTFDVFSNICTAKKKRTCLQKKKIVCRF